jgi:hypothetical protein
VPDSIEAKRSSRRDFLTRTVTASGVVAATALAGAAPAALGNKRKAVYKLGANEPYYHCRSGDSTCEGCKACHKHARHKLFPSENAADRHRAHKHCRCGIRKAFTLDRETWLKLFGPPDHRRKQVDKRDKRVRRILNNAD